MFGEHDPARKVWRQPGQLDEQLIRDLDLDLVPALGAIVEVVRKKADELESVPAGGRPRRIDHGGCQREEHRAGKVDATGSITVQHGGIRLERLEDANRHAWFGALRRVETRSLAQCVVRREHGQVRLPPLDAGAERVWKIGLANQAAEMLDMDGGHDRFLGFIGRAVGGLHGGRTTAIDCDPHDRLRGEDRATAFLDDPSQRHRQLDRSAFGQDPAQPLATGDERKRHEPCLRLVQRVQGHERDPREEGSHVVFAETLLDDVEGAALPDRQHLVPERALPREFVDLGRRPRRRRALRVDHGRHLIPFGKQLTVGGGVGRRESRQLGAGSIQVAPHGDRGAVEKRHGEDRVRMQVLEAVSIKLELVVAHQWVALDEVVRRRARIVDVAGQSQLLARSVTTNAWRAFEHQNPKARARCVGGGDEVVVARAGEDDVVPAHAVAPSAHAVAPK